MAAAARDRGWGQGVQQRQPKPTSTYMTKSAGKGKSHGKGKKGAKMIEEANWASKSGKKGKSFSKAPGKGPKESSELTKQDAKAEGAAMAASEGLVDTGATATAGGQEAVNRLCAAVAAARPDTKIVIHERERPYFRYGSGKWGRALFKVDLVRGDVVFSLFALPSEGVPVLIGVKELKMLDAFLGCASGRCIVSNHMVQLRKTPKGHLVMDIVEHVFYSDKPKATDIARYKPTSTTTTTRPPTSTARAASYRTAKPVYKWVPKAKASPCRSVRFSVPDAKHTGYMLEMQPDMCEEQAFASIDMEASDLQRQSEFLGRSIDELRYVLGSGDMRRRSEPETTSSLTRPFEHGGLGQRHGELRDEGGDSRSRSRGGLRGDAAASPSDLEGQGPQQEECQGPHGVRPHETAGSGHQAPQVQDGRVAVLRTPWLQGWGQPLRQMVGVRHLWPSTSLHPAPGESTRTNLPQNVVEALERLRMQGYEPDNLVAKNVKAMIDIVSREKRLIAGKPKAAPKKAVEPTEKDEKKKKETTTAIVLGTEADQDNLEGYEKVDEPAAKRK